MLQRLGKVRRGFTLNEMAIVMAVIGVMLGSIWALGGRSFQLQRANDAVAELQMSAANIVGILQGQTIAGANGSFLTKQMLSGSAIPLQYRNSGASAANGSDAANHPWGTGLFRVYKQGPQLFRIAFYIVPTEGCIQLLTQGTACNSGTLGCPSKVLVKNGTVSQSPDANTGWQVMTLAQANTLCGNNTYPTANETLNSVEFEYSLL